MYRYAASVSTALRPMCARVGDGDRWALMFAAGSLVRRSAALRYHAVFY
jgi:hypothetical protein